MEEEDVVSQESKDINGRTYYEYEAAAPYATNGTHQLARVVTKVWGIMLCCMNCEKIVGGQNAGAECVYKLVPRVKTELGSIAQRHSVLVTKVAIQVPSSMSYKCDVCSSC